MSLKSIAAAVSVAGLLATAPAAPAAAKASDEAWPPGNCPQGTFCVWPNWAEPGTGPVETPSLVTATNWSGSVPGLTYYNYTSQNVDMQYYYTWPDGSKPLQTHCVRPGGNIFYLPMTVTKLTWRNSPCPA